MSFTEPEPEHSVVSESVTTAELQARRQDLRRRRGRRRLDVAIGVLLALFGILVAPGRAVVAIVAVIVLLVCALSFFYARRRQRRARVVGSARGSARGGRQSRARGRR
jgi:Flp pilus assembly protein TadB